MSTDYVVETINLNELIIEDRQRKEYKNIESLAADIQENGLINPLSCRRFNGSGYRLVCGGRRTAALKSIGVVEAPAHIYPEDTPDLKIEAIELSENIHREQLTWAEEIAAKKRVHDLMVAVHGVKTSTSPNAPGHSLSDTARMTGSSKGNLSDDINLAKCIEELPMLAECKTKNDAKKLIEKLHHNAKIKEIARKIEASGGSVDERKKALINSYIVGDFFTGVSNIPDNTFHIIECDPPYGVDYNTDNRGVDGRGIDAINYNEVPKEGYAAFTRRLLAECKRLLHPNGWLIFWYADDPWGETVFRQLDDLDFKVPAHHPIWYKGKGRGVLMAADYRLASDYASFYYARQGNATINKRGHGLVFEHPPVYAGDKYHPTERPVSLMQEVLDVFGIPGNKVLVPFAGSGCTLLAASNLKMHPMGFDLSAEYKAEFAVRVEGGTYGDFK